MEKPLAPAAYQSLAELRYQIRRFLYFSEQAARDAGLEPQQHQLMLALKGLPKGARVLRELSLHHRSELRTLGSALVTALKRAMQSNQNPDRVAGNRGSARRRRSK